MKLKKEYILLGIVVVALILYIFFKNTDKTHYSLPELGKIEKSAISKLVVNRPGGAFTLERQGEQWKIQPQGYPAEKGSVDRMLDVLGAFELSTLVSESKNYSQYELTDDKKIGLEVYVSDKSPSKFDVGKTASTYQHTYIRLDGDHRVYQARGNIRQPLDVDIDRLRDKVVAKIEKDLVSGITLKSSEETLTIRKYSEPQAPPALGEPDSVVSPPSPPVWSTEDGRTAQEGIIQGIINSLASLRCTEFIEGKNKSDYMNPMFTVTIEGASPLTLEIFEKIEENKYVATSSQSDYPFVLTEYIVNRIKKTADEVLEKAEAGE